MGADLEAEPELTYEQEGSLSFRITASLPDSGIPDQALMDLAERWIPAGAEYERVEYGYDLIDHPRNRRRAYHRHDVPHFLSAFDVAVHEHCEELLREPTCNHYAGDPVLDAYAGTDLLMRAWTDGPLGCSELRCLD